MLMCVSMNINYDQSAAKGGFAESNLRSGLGPIKQTAVVSWDSLSSTLRPGFPFKGYATGDHSDISLSSL